MNGGDGGLIMKALFSTILLLLIVSQYSHANYIDKAIAKALLRSVPYVITNYPIIVSSIVLVMFHKQFCSLLADNEVTRLMGEYPVVSFVVGLVALKIVLTVIGSS